MLTELRITNFAIIDSLELALSPGLVVFTGETGAGKSIIFDAVESLIGGRVDANLVRSGAEQAVLEGTFRIPDAVRQPIGGLSAYWQVVAVAPVYPSQPSAGPSSKATFRGRQCFSASS